MSEPISLASVVLGPVVASGRDPQGDERALKVVRSDAALALQLIDDVGEMLASLRETGQAAKGILIDRMA
jgi:hypothetical protein